MSQVWSSTEGKQLLRLKLEEKKQDLDWTTLNKLNWLLLNYDDNDSIKTFSTISSSLSMIYKTIFA